MTRKLILAAMCVGFALPTAAHADQVSDLAALHAQMLQMQKDYAARMAALEKRLAKAEAEAKAAKQSASAATTTAKSAAASAKATAVRLAAVPPLPAERPATVPATAPATALGLRPKFPRRTKQRPWWSLQPRGRRQRRPPRTTPSIPASPPC